MANPYFVAAPLTVYDGDIAKASDLNNMGVSLETAFDLSDQILQTITTDTAALVALANADVVLTHADVALTHADVVLTHADVVLTHADVVLTHADAANTALDKAATNADVILTHADVVLTHADVTSAAASALAAATSYDNFDDRYLGAKAADPTLDNDGNSLLTGALYWNTVANEMRIYTGAIWVNPTATAIVGPVSAVDSQIVLFDSTTGKLAKAATTTGILKGTSGVIGAAVSGTDIKTINSTAVLGSGDIAVQPTLVSGTNIKTINSTTVLGSGDISVQPTLVSGTNIKTVGGNTLLGSGNLELSITDSITHLLHPTLDGNFRDLYRAGALPSWFNQQWGGAQWGNLPDGSFGSVATGSIEDNSASLIGDSAGRYYESQGFKVAENLTNPTIWLKLYKIGNPVNLVTSAIYADNAGSPNLSSLIGGLTAPASRSITSKSDGEWYPFIFSGSLSANTQYHIVIGLGVDASNHLGWKRTASPKYPFGFQNDGTSTPVWTQQAGRVGCFLIQNPSANSLIQSGGMFGNYKLAFNNGTPINQSRSLAQPLSQFYDGKECSVIHRGTYAASSNVWDFAYGLDHDRITVTINASGYPVLSIYEADRTLAQVTGTGAVTTGNHDVAIKVRTVGDGADYAYLYVDGASVGTPLTSQTFTMSKEMRDLGTARLGDGFGIIPTWTQDMQMTSLPSAQGWTYGGTATEANAYSVQNGKLQQNANGYTSLQTGYYFKTLSAVNSTGWSVAGRLRVPSSQNTSGEISTYLYVGDGTKQVILGISEYFLQIASAGTLASPDFTVQGDFKTQEHVFVLHGKGSDYYLEIDGKIAIDGTGKLISTSTNNQIFFGDASATAAQNSDAIWSYVKYYTGGMLLPTANNKDCSEFAHWSGDKSALFTPLWNGGSPVSVKELCGVEKNYIGDGVTQKGIRRGVSANVTTSGVTLLADMEAYIIGSNISQSITASVSNTNVNGYTQLNHIIDGVAPLGFYDNYMIHTSSTSSALGTVSGSITTDLPVGLHKAELRWTVSSSTSTCNAKSRTFITEAKS